MTILRAIATAIAHKTARRNPALRHPSDGASVCRSTLFRSWTPSPAPHRRRPRPTGRYQTGNGGACGARESRTPRTAHRTRRCHRGRSRVPEPAAGVRRRIAEPGPPRPAGAAFRLPAAWGSCAHLQMVPCLRKGAPAGDAPCESGGNAVARGQLDFAMAAIGNLYPTPQAAAGPQARRDRVLPSPLFLVSEPEPAWIMPTAGTFMRGRHAARPECMAPPRTARPQPGGKSGRICACFRELREDGCLRRRPGLRHCAASLSTMPGPFGSLIARRAAR